MQKAFRFRLDPTPAQTRKLERTLAWCCDLYNACLEQRRTAYRNNRVSVKVAMPMRELPDLKDELAELHEVYSQVLQNVWWRVHAAYQQFFRRVRQKNGKAGYPRFRSRRRYDSLTYPPLGFQVVNDRLQLSKRGNLKIKLHRPLEGRIKTLTIRRTATGKWFAGFSCEDVPAQELPHSDKALGIEVGLDSFATLSAGTKIENPRFFRQDEKALAKAPRQLSKAEKARPERAKPRRVVAHIHERLANRRNNFAHQLSRRRVNEYGIICFEDLTIRNMLQNGHFAKSISDAAWSQLIQFTAYQAEEAGRRKIESNPRGTSQECSDCGAIVRKDLSVRIHICQCGAVYDRDHNAARNILSRGLARLAYA